MTEKRIKELERKVEIMRKAMLKLQEWMDEVGIIQDIDEGLFESLNKRIARLENNI